ncbi:tetratricopeptide repeat protein [Treponema sp. OMZ 840]|uniref:tetratricopeptide repeat protein n=1 Tax=Treponema sp. OMZ 840 TaxID=244313 RepID=UPI003D92A930
MFGKVKKSGFSKAAVFFICAMLLSLFVAACMFPAGKNKHNKSGDKEFYRNQNELFGLLEKTETATERRFSIINQIASNYRREKKDNELILFLTDYVKKYPDDKYNAYWLLLTAYIYQEKGAEPIAEMYFERIIKNYGDLSIQGKSIHILCLQNLVQISTSPENRIDYFNQLITHFPDEINKTELYVRLALEYEKMGEWNQALQSYSLFLAQEDASKIQIPTIPDAYSRARRLVDFNNSPKDWTFESLAALETAVKDAISAQRFTTLDKYRSKVNFFAMSWKQDAGDPNSQVTFSMRDFGYASRIRYNVRLDAASNPNEAYLRTWGWRSYIKVWYLYFRKVNFPLNPEIHGRWEWAGIYYGEKL